MKYEYYQFANGLRLVHRHHPGNVAHLGVVVNVGSRDETENEQGLAHFIEHLLFKGTHKRSNFRVLSRLENVGADLNAFTTREDTSIFASFAAGYFERAAELLADIIFQSVFPQAEIEKEKAVIIDELNSYKDNPAEWIHDEFDEKMFAGHPLGRNILGTKAAIRNHTRSTIESFHARHYMPQQMVVSSVSHFSLKTVVRIIGKHFLLPQNNAAASAREPFINYLPFSNHQKYSRHQSHLVTGNIACSAYDDQRIAMALLNNILGGPAMSSRLNLLLREKNGIAYHVESSFQPFTDTGLFSIYCGTDPALLSKAIWLINKELKALSENALSPVKLHIAQRQLKGQLAVSLESKQNEMLAMGKNVLLYDKVDSMIEICRKIDEVKTSDLLEVANRVFEPAQMSTLIFGTV